METKTEMETNTTMEKEITPIKKNKYINRTGLSNNGYTLRKEYATEEEIKMIKCDLTMKPKITSGYGAEQPKPFKIYRENNDKIYMPSKYGFDKFGKPDINKQTTPTPMNCECFIRLRPNQEIIVAKYMEEVGRTCGGIISAKCGEGKTAIGLYLAAAVFKVKTLILVHTEPLANQWVERIREFIPSAIVGRIQGKKAEITGYDFVIGMIQTISKKTYEYMGFGFLICDEAHHLGAKVFSNALQNTNFKYTLGLTATPDRTDGMMNVFIYFLGKIVYRSSVAKTNLVVKLYNYNDNRPQYCQNILNFKRKPDNVKMISNITAHKPRNLFIVSLLPNLLAENRRILILSERRKHIDDIYSLIEKCQATQQDSPIYAIPPTVKIGRYVGGMKKASLDDALTCEVIIGSYTLISEGFDCAALDTLIMATPKREIEQIIGRIQRKTIEQQINVPLVIDICDLFSCYKIRGFARIKYYKKHQFRLLRYNVDFDEKYKINYDILQKQYINVNNIDNVSLNGLGIDNDDDDNNNNDNDNDNNDDSEDMEDDENRPSEKSGTKNENNYVSFD